MVLIGFHWRVTMSSKFEIERSHGQTVLVEVDQDGRVRVYGDFKEVIAFCKVSTAGDYGRLVSTKDLQGDLVGISVKREIDYSRLTATAFRTSDRSAVEPQLKATLIERDLPSIKKGFHILAYRPGPGENHSEQVDSQGPAGVPTQRGLEFRSRTFRRQPEATDEPPAFYL